MGWKARSPGTGSGHSGVLRLLVRSPLWLFVIAAALRLGLVERHGIWADEIFSLAMATGHSLEHPAAVADPTQGDYVELPEAVPPAVYSRYAEHDSPAAGPARVLRAVFLSESSPPLYFLLLNFWTRAFGTGDAALRLFSVACALACFPLLWSLARRVGGRAARWPTVILFTFSPVCIFYSTEGRMYALLWLVTAGFLWLSVDLQAKGVRPVSLLLWIVVGAAGFLTHYFFAFVWVGVVAWLLLRPGRCSRRSLLGGTVLVGLLILPWYLRVPASLANWRVTMGWLNDRPGHFDRLASSLQLLWSFFSVSNRAWGVNPGADWFNLAVFLILVAAALWTLGGGLLARRRLLLWVCVLSAWLGVMVFDLWRGTYAVDIPRYVFAGLPAAFLLAGLALGKLWPGFRAVLLSLIVLACLVGIRRIYLNDNRQYEPYPDLGEKLAGALTATDVVIVHSIPSGVVGVARYLERQGASAKGLGFASWVGQLKQRHVPEDVLRLTAGRRQVALVIIHEVSEPAPEAAWLTAKATLTHRDDIDNASVLYFTPRRGRFFPSSPAKPTVPARP